MENEKGNENNIDLSNKPTPNNNNSGLTPVTNEDNSNNNSDNNINNTYVNNNDLNPSSNRNNDIFNNIPIEANTTLTSYNSTISNKGSNKKSSSSSAIIIPIVFIIVIIIAFIIYKRITYSQKIKAKKKILLKEIENIYNTQSIISFSKFKPKDDDKIDNYKGTTPLLSSMDNVGDNQYDYKDKVDNEYNNNEDILELYDQYQSLLRGYPVTKIKVDVPEQAIVSYVEKF